MVSAEEILNGFFKDYPDGGVGYYRGMVFWFLERNDYSSSSIEEWLNHEDVMKWGELFIMGQAILMVEGVRDVRIHDITISTLRKKI